MLAWFSLPCAEYEQLTPDTLQDSESFYDQRLWRIFFYEKMEFKSISHMLVYVLLWVAIMSAMGGEVMQVKRLVDFATLPVRGSAFAAGRCLDFVLGFLEGRGWPKERDVGFVP